MSCAASPSPQSANDGEALYKKMQAAIAASKPLRIQFTSSVEDKAAPLTRLKGTLAIEEGNKAEFEVEGQAGTRKFTLKLTSDGTKVRIHRLESPPPPDLGPLPPTAEVEAPKTLTGNLASAMARGGAWLAQEYFDGEYRAAADRHFKAMQGIINPPPTKETDVTDRHLLKAFKLVKKEKVGDRTAQAVSYDLVRTGEMAGLFTTVTVWIDVETSLPLKREGKVFTTMTRPAGGKEETVATHVSTWVETYEK
jgi:hypothetical protein